MSIDDAIIKQSPYATLALIISKQVARISLHGPSSQAVRTLPTVRMMQEYVRRPEFRDGRSAYKNTMTLIQYFDIALNEMRSVAFCRPNTMGNAVRLIPDTYFYFSSGYESLRKAVEQGELPHWKERKQEVFWRGSPTIDWFLEHSNQVSDISSIPRVRMCLLLKERCKWADAAVAGSWGSLFPSDVSIKFYAEHGILAPFIKMQDHANYRYLIDIDGVGNAWSFFEKLLLGSTILKISSPYCQWFYDSVIPWKHFVPVRSDCSDLIDKLNWCAEHAAECEEIALTGQRFALSHTFEVGCRAAVKEIIDCAILL